MSKKNTSSFRDPAGFLFYENGALLRQINPAGRADYTKFIDSGLYDRLLRDGLIIAHEEISVEKDRLIIKPTRLPFVSYPYEWCFSMYKQAALTTLKIQQIALSFGQTLKDASAYNIQFSGNQPLLIDTLSFTKYKTDSPWQAYRQYCRHFLAPLALMSKKDIRLGQLMRVFIDGLPLDLASGLLDKSSWLSPSLLIHLHAHAQAEKKFSHKAIRLDGKRISKTSLLALLDNLEKTIINLKWKMPRTEWGDYYDHTNYNDHALDGKKNIINDLLTEIKPGSVWDLGANNGFFSRLAGALGAYTVAFDIDWAAVEKNYKLAENRGEKNILPLFLDLNDPSPSRGWAGEERQSLEQRGPADTIMALALVHHLAISNNVPFEIIARYFSRLGSNLIIEFVPKSDSNAKRLLASRPDIFSDYNENGFEKSFNRHYNLIRKIPVSGTQRTLYLMKSKAF